MNPYDAYKQLAPVAATRIDLLLAVFDGAINQISAAIAQLQTAQHTHARLHMMKAQVLVGELAAGVRVDLAPEMATNMLRLYEFAAHELAKADIESLTAAQNVLITLREGFEAIRVEAVALERSGQVPPVDSTSAISATA